MPAAKVPSNLAAIWGIEDGDELDSGLFLDTFSESFTDPYEFLRDKVNTRQGFAHKMDEEHVITVSGEVKSEAARPFTDTFGSASAITSSLTGKFITGTGDFFMTDAGATSNRAAWKSFTASYTRWPDVTAAGS